MYLLEIKEYFSEFSTLSTSFNIFFFILQNFKFLILSNISTFLGPPFSHLLHKISRFILRIFHLQINSFCILFNYLITVTGMLIINAKCIILERARALKTGTLPSPLRVLILQYLRSFSILTMSFTNVFLLAICLLKSRHFPLNFVKFLGAPFL